MSPLRYSTSYSRCLWLLVGAGQPKTVPVRWAVAYLAQLVAIPCLEAPAPGIPCTLYFDKHSKQSSCGISIARCLTAESNQFHVSAACQKPSLL